MPDKDLGCTEIAYPYVGGKIISEKDIAQALSQHCTTVGYQAVLYVCQMMTHLSTLSNKQTKRQTENQINKQTDKQYELYSH